MRAKLKTENGFTIIEVLIAITVLTIGILAVSSMQVYAIRSNAFASHQTQGTTMALDRLEKLMSLSYDDSDLAAGNHTDPSPPSEFSIAWDVEDNTPLDNAKRVKVTVRWTDHGIQKYVSVERIIPRMI
jgi:prepilin-type N-terminal cleavage/methylation domain-containing protein